MIDTILGIAMTMLTGFGYGTLYCFTFFFWYAMVIKYIERKYGYNFVIDYCKTEDVKDDKKEKT